MYLGVDMSSSHIVVQNAKSTNDIGMFSLDSACRRI